MYVAFFHLLLSMTIALGSSIFLIMWCLLEVCFFWVGSLQSGWFFDLISVSLSLCSLKSCILLIKGCIHYVVTYTKRNITFGVCHQETYLALLFFFFKLLYLGQLACNSTIPNIGHKYFCHMYLDFFLGAKQMDIGSRVLFWWFANHYWSFVEQLCSCLNIYIYN